MKTFHAMTTGLILLGSIATFIPDQAAHAQFLTGGNPSSPALSGCILLNLTPTLIKGPCSGNPPGQLAGSVWVANIRRDGVILSGANWVRSVLPNTGGQVGIFTVTFTNAFPQKPVCVASLSELTPPNTPDISASDETTSSVLVRSGGLTVATGVFNYPLGFHLMCSIGQ